MWGEMPTRFIKESCRSSKNLDKISDFEERLFWRLVTTADDFGRFLADFDLVKAFCFPYRDISPMKIEKALLSLQTHDLIMLYSVDDRLYGEFVQWERHQGKPRATKSKHPSPITVFNENKCLQLLADASRCITPSDTDTDTDLILSSLNALQSLTLTDNPKIKSNDCATNGRNYRDESKTILSFLNEKTGKRFREVDANLAFIEARLRSGVEVQDCRTLIARKVRDWGADEKMTRYLRPETLFNKTKFETYLAEVTT